METQSIDQATVSLSLPTADDPFNRVECRVLDVGHADNVLTVESDAVNRLQQRLATMEAAVRAADRLLDASTDSPYGTYRMYGQGPLAIKLMNADRGRVDEARELLETEVPDAG